MDIEALAAEYDAIASDMNYNDRTEHGMERAPGWFNLYNETTSQSKIVLLHMESGLVFKQDYSDVPMAASRRYVGEVTINDKHYPVRLPEFYVVNAGTFDAITAQEYCIGTHCGCDTGGWCDHADAMKVATRCDDAHFGNWKIVGDEIVLFDFEGIDL